MALNFADPDARGRSKSTTMLSSCTSADGLRIRWSQTGHSPKTVIFVHGWTCDQTVWRSQISCLATTYRVVTLDLPGHGQSQPVENAAFSMDLLAHAVEAVRFQTKAARVVLVGHSLGAQAILRYNLLYPGRAAALVLVEGVVRHSKMLALAAHHLDQPNGKRNFETIIRKALFVATTSPEIQKHVLDIMLGTPTETALGVVRAMLDEKAWNSQACHLPVLAVYQERSRFADYEILRSRFASLECAEISGAGHFLMMEKAEEFNRILRRFLAKQEF